MNKFFVLAIFCAAVSFTVNADSIPVKGEWGGRDLRSSSPVSSRPSASIDGNVLSIAFTSALSNLTVTVTDESGSLVYMDCISGGSGTLLPNVSGSYELNLIHQRGTLSGDFEI